MYSIYFSEIESKLVSKSEVVRLDILPEEFSYSCDRAVTTHDMLGLGDVLRPGKRKLFTYTINSVLEPYGTYEVGFMKELFTSLLDSKVPFYFSLIRKDESGRELFSDQVKVIAESVEFKENEGEIGTLYYNLKLKEYIPFYAKAEGELYKVVAKK